MTPSPGTTLLALPSHPATTRIGERCYPSYRQYSPVSQLFSFLQLFGMYVCTRAAKILGIPPGWNAVTEIPLSTGPAPLERRMLFVSALALDRVAGAAAFFLESPKASPPVRI